MKNSCFFLDYLGEELARRHEKNARYSTRAFAKSLDVDVASLSRILSGKQIPSYKVCQKIFLSLQVPPAEQHKLLASVATTRKIRGLKRVPPEFRKLESISEDRLNLETDLWRSIADWYHGAILELTYVKGFRSDPKWIAQQFGISEPEAIQAIRRLERMKLLVRQNGVLKKANEQVSSGNKAITTPAHKRLQMQVLTKAKESLENDPIEIRNMSSMAMAIDPEKMPIAKKMIQDFSRELCRYLESGKRAQVYQLGICFYPISKKGENNEK